MLLAAALSLPCIAFAAEVLGTITILEGQALIYRGSGRLQAVEGVRLAPGDIVETAPSTFAQLEFADRSVVQFGPSTRVLVNASTLRQKPDRSLYILDGWVKVASTQREAGDEAGFDLRAPQFEIPASPAVIVLRNAPAEVALFVELGSVRLTERPQGAGGAVVASLGAGNFYQRKLPARGVVASGAAPVGLVGDMPRAFRDSLPSRIERYRNREVQAKDAPAFAYADVQAWLQAEPAVRRPLMQRWRVKAREPAFRAALIANLAAHPEWDPILFPEKYKPKEPPPRAATPNGRGASAASAVAP